MYLPISSNMFMLYTSSIVDSIIVGTPVFVKLYLKILKRTVNPTVSDGANAKKTRLLKGPPIWGASQKRSHFLISANAGVSVMYRSVHA